MKKNNPIFAVYMIMLGKAQIGYDYPYIETIFYPSGERHQYLSMSPFLNKIIRSFNENHGK